MYVHIKVVHYLHIGTPVVRCYSITLLFARISLSLELFNSNAICPILWKDSCPSEKATRQHEFRMAIHRSVRKLKMKSARMLA